MQTRLKLLMIEMKASTMTESNARNVVELRQYTLHPHQRDVLIDLFDREFVETQEAAGMRVLGQFREPDEPDRFVWLRAFADMAARRQALESFYGGPVWAAHRNAANATMIDSDNVLLLRPAWAGSGMQERERAAPGAYEIPPGLIDLTVFYLNQPADAELLAFCRGRMTSTLTDGGAVALGWYVTEPTANTFPRLPVREGEQVLVGLALFNGAAAFDAFAEGRAWAREVALGLSKWLAKPPESHRLVPTARSAIHA
jgi:quinol monooxygenase YgiN